MGNIAQDSEVSLKVFGRVIGNCGIRAEKKTRRGKGENTTAWHERSLIVLVDFYVAGAGVYIEQHAPASGLAL